MPSINILLKGHRLNNSGWEIPARVFDVSSREEARAYAKANAPAKSGFVLDDVDVGEFFAMQHMVVVSLRYVEDKSDETNNPIPDPTYSFDYTGGQVFRQVAVNTQCYPPIFETYCNALKTSLNGVHPRKVINYNRDEHTVDGVNLPILSDVVQYTKNVVVRASNFNLGTDLFNIYRYRLHVNTEAWGAFPALSVLFLGASGNLGDDDRWAISYKFAVGANRADATDIVAGISINKNAHDYVETWFDYIEGGELFKSPVGVKVHTVFSSFNFSLLKGII